MSSIVNLNPLSTSLAEVRGTKAAENLRQAASGKSEKVQSAARDFESVLLGHWLEQAQQSFATVPGADADEDADPSREQYQSLALQAVATSISASGRGLGIAAMVAKHLDKPAAPASDPAKMLENNNLHKTTEPLHGIPLKSDPEGVTTKVFSRNDR